MLDTLLAPAGRTGRLGFWTVLPALGILYEIAGLALIILGDGLSLWPPIWLGVALGALTLAFLGVGAIAGIRRLHDRNESGWWILLGLVPVFGQLWYLGWNGIRRGRDGVNRFDAEASAAIGAVFDDAAPAAPRRRRQRASLALAIALWLGFLLTTGVTILLFRQPSG